MFTEIALAESGIPQTPAREKVRWLSGASAGPPSGPMGFRVSTARHGVRVKKLRLPPGGGGLKFAVMLASALIENVVEADPAEKLPPIPDQPLKIKPVLGVALSNTSVPDV
jgi:hypothetical protein